MQAIKAGARMSVSSILNRSAANGAMSWREFFRDYAETLGVTLFFAAVASGFMLKAREKKSPITAWHAVLVIVAGQVTGSVVTAFAFGYLGWSGFFAPLIGTLCGLVGLFFLMAILGAGERVELRGADLGDAAIDLAAKQLGGKASDK